MSEVREVHSLAQLARILRQDMRSLERAARKAGSKAAKRGKALLKQAVPVAHGELRESVHTEGAKIVVDAPHAAAVNNGSRPHWPPLEPLIEWVKLRGTQGLLTDRQIGRLPGSTTASAARGVAGMLAAHESGGALGTDAPEKIARAIQQAIGRHGTKPHHFVEKSLDQLYAIFGEELRKALHGDPKQLGGDADDPLSDPKRQFFEGSRGGVYYHAKGGGKVWVKKSVAAQLRGQGRVKSFQPK